MIKSDNCSVTFRGDYETLSIEFVMIIHAFRKSLTEVLGKEDTELLIADLGKLAFIDDDEKDIAKKFDEILEASPLLERGDKHE